MDVSDHKFRGGSSRTFRQPHEQIFLLSLLEKHTVVARLFEAHFINYIPDVFPVQFRLKFSVWDLITEVFDKVSHATGDAS